MRTIYSVFFFLLTYFSSQAQQKFEIGAPGETGGNYGTVSYYDPSLIGQKKIELLSYKDIDGSPFWDDRWNTAILFTENKKGIKISKVKLNLYTNDVHYINNNNVELVAETGTIKKVIFFKREDTTKVLAEFESLPDISGQEGYAYYRVLNNGKLKLLELQKASIRKAAYDPLQGKNPSGFYLKTLYAFSDNGNVSHLKALNRDYLFSIIHVDGIDEEWLKQNKNKLKSESEIVSFLNYYNSK